MRSIQFARILKFPVPHSLISSYTRPQISIVGVLSLLNFDSILFPREEATLISLHTPPWMDMVENVVALINAPVKPFSAVRYMVTMVTSLP